MPKKSQVRTLTESQHVKVSETLLKFSRRWFCHILVSIWKNFSSKNDFLVVSEFLGLFVNLLTPDDEYSLLEKVNV